MTNQQHPIIPPPELIEDWIEIAKPAPWRSLPNPNVLCTLAAQWGADQELEECIEWLKDMELVGSGDVESLLAARRPKPQSLKEQALDALGPEPLPETGPTGDTILNKGSIERHRTIRRALEQLDD